MKTLVTGGGGFLGRHIVEELRQRGREVIIFARGAYPGTSYRGSVEDFAGLEKAFRGVDEVFHVAAKVGVWGNWNDFYRTNFQGTENVIRACKSQSVKRLIYTSSPSVVFDGEDHRGVDESYPYPDECLSFYSQSKKMAEKLVVAANRPGLSTVVLRPHLIWGKGDPHLIPRVIAQAKAGKLRRVGDGKNRVDIIHVKNAARAHVQAADRLAAGSDCAGKIYFLSQGKPVVLWDFINEILRREKLPPVSKSISFENAHSVGAVMEAGYRLFSAKHEPRMTRFLAHSLAKDHYYNIGAAVRDLGYVPEVTTEAGLDEMFGSYKKVRPTFL